MVIQHHAQRRHQGRVVLQRLAHAHHHHVGDDALATRAQALAQRMLGIPELGQDLARAEVAAEALVTRGAEAAAHGTAGLGRHAQRAPVIFGNENGFDGIAVPHVEQPLDRSIGRHMLGQNRQGRDVGTRLELLAQGLGQIAHLVEIAGASLVDPAEQLRCAETLLAELFAISGQSVEIKI